MPQPRDGGVIALLLEEGIVPGVHDRLREIGHVGRAPFREDHPKLSLIAALRFFRAPPEMAGPGVAIDQRLDRAAAIRDRRATPTGFQGLIQLAVQLFRLAR